MHIRALTITCVLVIAAIGCNDDLDEQLLTASSGDFAVLSDNYMGATSVSLLDSKGGVSKDEWVGSKTSSSKLRTPLSDDVVLPTVSSAARYLTTIERTLGVLTRFDLESGEVLGQVRSDDSPEADEAAFHSNPQDVLYVSDESAWISRWRHNPDGDAEERERGNDLIEWNPASFERGDRRIDLSELDEEIEEMVFDKDGKPTGTAKAIAYASPANLVPLRDAKLVAVGITGITLSYNYAPGKLAIVDPKNARLVSVLALEGFSNCGEVKPVSGDATSIIVSCTGAYGDSGEHGGVLKITVNDAGKASIARSYRNADHKDAAQLTGNVASLGGDIVVAVAAGHIDAATMRADTTDQLLRIDLESGEQTMLLESEGAFGLGSPSFSEASGLLLVPDAGKSDDPSSGVQRFEVDAKREVKRVDFVDVAGETGLAARQVLAL